MVLKIENFGQGNEDSGIYVVSDDVDDWDYGV